MKIGAVIAGSSPAFALDHRVFNASTFLGCIFTICAGIINTLTGLIAPGIISVIGAVCYGGLFYLARFRSKFESLVGPFIAVTVLLLSGAWFANGGILGAIPVIIPLALMLFLTMRSRGGSLRATLLLCAWIIILFGLETLYPGFVIAYPNETTRRVDILSSLIVTSACMAWMLNRFRRAYDEERSKVQRRNRDLKNSQRELVRARNEAEQSARAKSEFLSVMSHEIRTPMNAVVGMTYLLEKENPRPEQLEQIRVLKESAETLTTLLNDILDFSKIESGKVVLDRTVFHLGDFLEKVTRLFQQKAEEKGLRLELHLSPRLPLHVLGDRLRLNQILMNLIGNAVKFTDTGTVRIRVRPLRRRGDDMVLFFTIVDTGIGIPDESLAEIFDSFAQARADSSWKYGGTGLGLTITRRLLEMQNGDIRVRSRQGRGSVFAFTLPMRIAPKGIPKATSPSQLVAFNHHRVLVVDDFEPNLLLARKFLENWELQVDTAMDGAQALEMLERESYHIVLMDLRMPKMDGFEASLRIRKLEDPVKRLIPIIAVTAAASPEERGRALRAGINDYLLKPYDPAELHAKISMLLKNET